MCVCVCVCGQRLQNRHQDIKTTGNTNTKKMRRVKGCRKDIFSDCKLKKITRFFFICYHLMSRIIQSPKDLRLYWKRRILRVTKFAWFYLILIKGCKEHQCSSSSPQKIQDLHLNFLSILSSARIHSLFFCFFPSLPRPFFLSFPWKNPFFTTLEIQDYYLNFLIFFVTCNDAVASFLSFLFFCLSQFVCDFSPNSAT